MKLKLGIVVGMVLTKKQRQKVSPRLLSGLRHRALEHLAFRVPSRTPMSSCRVTKQASAKLKLGGITDSMLVKKQRKKCLKFG